MTARRANSAGSFRSRRSRVDPEVKAIIVIFVGVLASIVAVFKLLPEDSSQLTTSVAAFSLFVIVGLIACWILRPHGLRESFAGEPEYWHTPLGVAAGAIAFGFSWIYVESVQRFFGLPAYEIMPDAPELTVVLAMAVLPAIVEEWTDRGVLWVAVRPLVSERKTIIVTAIVFAFMHGLQGPLLLNLPHRLVAGLVFGWIRAKTGSLLPCMLAHFVHNILALTL